MSRIPKYYVEKAKVKVVFRLQFHATHIPQSGWDKLYLSFIPIETGKASAKTNKANVRNGTCKWSDPVYEATRLLQDPRTRTYDEKLYKLVVAMGSSRSSILGEVNLNLADFAEAQKPCSVSLPLQGCDFGVVLHVTVQLLTTKTGSRDVSQQRGEINSKSSQPNLRSHYFESEMARIKDNHSSELRSIGEASESNEDYDESGVAIDGSSCTSDGNAIEKTEVSGALQLDSFQRSFSGSPNISGEEFGSNRMQRWSSDISTEMDPTASFGENNRLRLRLEVAESAFLQLKSEAKSLQRITDELSTETKGLAQHLASEIDSGQQLTKEVLMLRAECSSLKRDLEKLRSARILQEVADSEISNATSTVLLNASGKLVPKHVGATSTLEDRICDLLQKLEESKTEKENLVVKMNHMECYYESYIRKLEENQKQILNEVDHLRNEHSSCYYTISVLQGQNQKAQDELSQQLTKFAEARSALESLNVKLESRAIASENALKRVRWNYSKAVDRLHKDLELLSFQVLSMYESNENITKQSVADAFENFPEECSNDEHCREHLLRMCHDHNEAGTNPTEHGYINGAVMRSQHCNGTGIENGDNIMEETVRKSLENVTKRCLSMEVELLDACVDNFEWKIYSDTLLQLQYDARAVLKHMESRISVLEQLLHEAKEGEARRSTENDHLSLKNQNLEQKLQTVSDDNAFLLQKVTEYQKLAKEGELYENKYRACEEERDKVQKLLMQESQLKIQLENDLRLLDNERRALKEDFDKQSLLYTDLQKAMESFKEQVCSLSSNMTLISKQMNLSVSDDVSLSREFESADCFAIFSTLDNLQRQMCQKVLDLSEQKNEIEEMKKSFLRASETAEQEMLAMRKKYESDIEAMTSELNLSGNCVESLKQDLQLVTEKFESCSDCQMKLQEINSDLVSRQALLEDQLHHAADEIGVLEEKLREFNTVLEELESTQIALANCREENQALTLSRADCKTELDNTRNSLQHAHANLLIEKAMREEFESSFLDIRLQLIEKNAELHAISDELSKLRHVEEKTMSLEEELSVRSERQKDLASENSSLNLRLTEADEQLTSALANMLAYETEAIYMNNLVSDLLVAVSMYEGEFGELHKKSREVDLLDEVRSHNEELEILSTILKCKLKEQQMEVSLLKNTEIELVNLQERHREVAMELANQIAKTEEYKNLLVHLKELKEKAEADYQHACARKEKEGSLFAMQESLRIAFIKEQYESKVSELMQQLSVSKRYAEETLVKLQNSLDEEETSKRNEVSLAKRIEELSVKISEMETELHDAISDRRELAMTVDSLKTELECTALSLDCCKEEKLKLEACLAECNEEHGRTKLELETFKRLLENISAGSTEAQENTELARSSVEDPDNADTLENNMKADEVTDFAKRLNSVNGMDDLSTNPTSRSTPLEVNQSFRDAAQEDSLPEEDSSVDTGVRRHFEEQQKLAGEMNLFQKALERLKNDNLSSLLPLDVELMDPSLGSLERSLSQLDTANENLEQVFPSFKELPSSGNALERVLALELELAESLHAKEESDNRFQSSFLKQHNDKAAVFQSFKDINELIQDMLELKRNHVAMETELKEMQGRYSQLSLEFAEVEGERQKLAMSLKSRSPRKT